MKLKMKFFKSAKNTEAYQFDGDPLTVPPVTTVYVSRAHLQKAFGTTPGEITVEITSEGYGPKEAA